jgi:hypothetical protein
MANQCTLFARLRVKTGLSTVGVRATELEGDERVEVAADLSVIRPDSAMLRSSKSLTCASLLGSTQAGDDVAEAECDRAFELRIGA